MRHILHLLVNTALLLLAFCSAADADSVRYVPDGDTLVLRHGEVVRLFGIDAPEIGRDGQPDGYYAARARALLASRVATCMVTLRVADVPKDHYGRTLATVILEDGTNLNEMMVSNGAAMAYYHTDVPEAVYLRMVALQKSAMLAKKGMWAGIPDRLKQGGPFIASRKSRRFFTTACDGADRIADTTRIVFADVWDAFFRGYVPARHCHIWPDQ